MRGQYNGNMVVGKVTALRFTPDDFAILDALQTRTGIGSRTDVVRLAIRTLAAAQGIDVAAVRAKKVAKPKA